MKVFLNEITDQETSLDFTENDNWVLEAVSRVDEKSEGPTPQITARPISTHLSLRKVDEIIIISGNIDTYIQLVCSRCATTYQHECRPEFSVLLCNDPTMAGLAQSEADGRLSGKNKGSSRHEHNFDEDADIMAGKDLDITYISKDFIDLGDVLTEQLQLQVPFQPLCQEKCKGICTQCGSDLNLNPCECKQSLDTKMFSALKNYKL